MDSASKLHSSNSYRQSATIDELNVAERNALEQLRYRMKDVLKGNESDYYLLRWLVARRFNLENAEKMLRTHLARRKRADLDNFLARPYQTPEIIRRYISMSNLGTDKKGNALISIAFGYTDFKGLAHSLSLYKIFVHLVFIIENALKEMEESWRKKGTTGMKFVVICDMQDAELARYLMSKFYVKGMMYVLRSYEANCPEILETMYFLNISPVFASFYHIMKSVCDDRTINKFRVFSSTEEAKEELLKNIDKEVLPHFLGGTRTDPDGNPDCLTLHSRNRRIPKELYLKHNHFEKIRNNKDFNEVTIARNSYHDHVIDVQDIGTLIHWQFCTLDYNIRFGVYFLRNGKLGKEFEKVWIDSLEYMDCHQVLYEWQVLCEENGTYVVRFDNTNSWMTSKKLFYKIDTRRT